MLKKVKDCCFLERIYLNSLPNSSGCCVRWVSAMDNTNLDADSEKKLKLCFSLQVPFDNYVGTIIHY